MTTTIEIPDEVLTKAMQAARTTSPLEATSPQEVVVKALEEFTRAHSQAELIQYLGTFDDFMTPEELDEMRRMD